MLTLPDLAKLLDDVATARGPAAKLDQVVALLRQCSALEAKYAIKIMVGDLRIGMRESLVEEAVALTYEQQEIAVRRANMLLGDIGETLRLAAEKCLDQARMRLFHPIGFMLAAEVKSSASTTKSSAKSSPANAALSQGATNFSAATTDQVVSVTQTSTGVAINATAPSNSGIVSRSGLQGSAVYTPDSGYSGRDSFTYTVTDARGLTSAPATVRLLVVSSRRRRSAEELLIRAR